MADVYKRQPHFCPLHVVSGGCQKLGDHAFNIVADIPGLRKGGGVGDGQGHIQKLCQGLDQIRLAAAGGSDH